MPHDGHDHPHAGQEPHDHLPDAPKGLTYHQAMEIAVRTLLIEKGIVSADSVRRQLEVMDSITPVRGSHMIAKAWLDPAFKALALEDGTKAAKALGLDLGPTHLMVVENKPDLHNVIVCTLCSCYPRTLLGVPPDWYKSVEYRSRVVREPRKVLEEFGTEIPGDVEIRVHDSTADLRYLVLPLRPAGTEGWSEDQLAALVTRDSMIGVSVARLQN